ncbi:EG45-like domain containing protein [Juglans microcarpa x Juglans regia]|uniref:EG45-like domain containing protein n=1 Tax=Juglans microcarpa x Juglans regia TaxID=2249226 RepID=UPI001B7E45FA|nr:EG45-like domain containing protein [Juglans microcarpa x Juglans regia]
MQTSFIKISLLVCLCCDVIILRALADIGTAKAYPSPYLPTRCSGKDENQLPSDGYFAAVSEGLWDNGGACGRKYRVRCISGPSHPCKGEDIVVLVVDHCRGTSCPATMALSIKAFKVLSRFTNVQINIEFMQV